MARITPEKSLYVEFAGMPKSGKTTVLDTVSHYLRRAGVDIREFHGGGRYAPIGKEQLGALNVYLACQAIQYLLEGNSRTRLPRLHLMDRGTVDRLIFTDALTRLGRVSKSHKAYIDALFLCEDIPRPDLCFIFVTSPELSIERENRNKLSKTPGRIMNGSLLRELEGSARSVVNAPGAVEVAGKTILVDTSEMDGRVSETAQVVLRHMAALFPRITLPHPSAGGS